MTLELQVEAEATTHNLIALKDNCYTKKTKLRIILLRTEMPRHVMTPLPSTPYSRKNHILKLNYAGSDNHSPR